MRAQCWQAANLGQLANCTGYSALLISYFKRVVQTCGANVWCKCVVQTCGGCQSLHKSCSTGQPSYRRTLHCTTMDNAPQVHSNASVQHSTWLFCRARPKVTPKTQNNSLKKVEPCHISYLKHVCQSYGMINRLWGPSAFCISTFYLFVFSQMQYFD